MELGFDAARCDSRASNQLTSNNEAWMYGADLDGTVPATQTGLSHAHVTQTITWNQHTRQFYKISGLADAKIYCHHLGSAGKRIGRESNKPLHGKNQ
jgi:hypothetical protein